MMRRILPRTLRGQLVLVILITFVVIQGISLWLFADERRLAVRAALGLEAAGRAANVVRLLEAAPAQLGPDILRTADSPLVRFSLADEPSVDHLTHGDGGNISNRIRSFLDDAEDHEVRVELHQITSSAGFDDSQMPMSRMHEQMMGLDFGSLEMRLSIALKDGRWLNVSTRFHRPPIQWPWESFFSFGLAMLIVAGVVWAALSRLTGPLRRLAWAAEGLGRGESIEPLPQQGPEELRLLTNAFKNMQARLSRFVSERTRLLAALGHDLRSPLTAMRVRSEMVEDDETRERLATIIDEMQEMVESTLSFARGMVSAEDMQTVDLSEFLLELVDDLKAIGGEIKLQAPKGIDVRIKPVAMRRALRNVIENAIRYGQVANITVQAEKNIARVFITDQGDGIPEADLERVFDPFVRVEKSRNLETGGTGLGLSIARTVIHAHGGDIRLENLPDKGLLVEISIPLDREEGKAQ